jgi:hypothetical protein
LGGRVERQPVEPEPGADLDVLDLPAMHHPNPADAPRAHTEPAVPEY